MSRQDFIFTRKYPERLYRHIVFWLAFYFFSLITYFHDLLEKTGFVNWMLLQSAEVFFHITSQIIFCYGVLYYLLPVFLNRKRYGAFVTGLIILSVAVYFILYIENTIFFKRIHSLFGLKFRPPALVYWFSLISFMSYTPVSTGLAIAIKMLKNWYTKQMENEQLISENASAELQLLKAQIHPHFLFNTLNNIYSFTLNKSPQSPVLVKKLSATLRYMINDCEASFVPLQKEVDMISDYMGLEGIRYGSRLNMKVQVKGDLENKLVAPLLLIPFIENSFKHGTSLMLEQPWISLFLCVEGNSFTFRLTNSKPSITPFQNIKNGIGLNNVKKRLALLYPSQHKLHIENSAKEFSVEMQIPV